MVQTCWAAGTMDSYQYDVYQYDQSCGLFRTLVPITSETLPPWLFGGQTMTFFRRDLVDVVQNMNKSHPELVNDKANLPPSTLETSQLCVKPAHFVALLAQRSSARAAAAGSSNKNTYGVHRIGSTILVYWFLLIGVWIYIYFFVVAAIFPWSCLVSLQEVSTLPGF